ncbi:MAG: hypothetical protein JRF33_10160 [Deltaproteobacteria bacterium]|nr:hypothetical protein [Deltaproteobacteria bacterium]
MSVSKRGSILFMQAILFVCFVLPGGTVQAKDLRRISAVVLPPYSPEGGAAQRLAWGMADRAGAELMGTGNYNHFHLKQVLSMARSHDMAAEALGKPAQALRAVRILGADSGVFGSLNRLKDGRWRLVFTAFEAGSSRKHNGRADLPADTAKAVEAGGHVLAGALRKLQHVEQVGEQVAHPHSDSAPAMDAYLSCYAVLVEQPMGLRKSHIIEPKRLRQARSDCMKAVELDPKFHAAWAALSIANALSFENEEALRALKQAQGAKGYLPLEPIAHYWMSTRFKSSAEGAQVLEKAADKHPGALILLTYLGEHLNISRRYSKALLVWERYLGHVKTSAYALAQKGYSLARLGKLDESIAVSRQAYEMDTKCLDLKLELASRLVDAKKLGEAESMLLPMSKEPDAFGEILLRLGYVYLLKKQDAKAEPLFKQALAMAKGPNEWRTRGRARYDLAIVMVRRNRPVQAEQHLLDAAAEGFLVKRALADNDDLKVLAKRPRVAKLFKQTKLKRNPLLLMSSPFPIDFAGEPRPDGDRPAPITGVRF